MSNQIRYIKNLEAVGVERLQAEAQVQMVFDIIGGDLVTKSELALSQERIENRFIQSQQHIQNFIKESEIRLMTRMTFLVVSTTSIAVAVLTWLIRI